jgi:uncharacterized cupin superfamily protein
VPIWPYHYHYGVEEWLYVIEGAPVLREPAGERTLAPGDLVAFAVGHAGAHTVKGPGRFVIFSAGQDVEPWLTIHVDSDKVSGPENILLRSGAVGYWHGEGTAGPSEPVEVVRQPDWSPPQPIVNVLRADGAVGPLLRAAMLDATVVSAEPEPYHYVHGREQWLLVLTGTPTLRHPDGREELEPGDLVCLPEGPAGAHQLLDRGDSTVRALLLSTTGLPANVHYPDSGQWLLRHGPGDEVRLP